MSEAVVDPSFVESRRGDLDFLGLELAGDTAASFTLTRSLARHDGRLYGGTAVAAAIALAEHASGRPSLWTTVQFVSSAASVGDRIDCSAEVLASGRRTTQLRMIARVGDQELFCALGATALAKDRAIEGTFVSAPDVEAPEDCPEFRFPLPESMRQNRIDMQRHMEIRSAGRDEATGELRFWARVQGRQATPAILGYLADMVPMAVVHAAGHMGGGTSLDNTLRVGTAADTEWILLQLVPHLAAGGYGTGHGLLWSPDGVLLATASQTASLIVID
jgi:acyl-CoA thioesterase